MPVKGSNVVTAPDKEFSWFQNENLTALAVTDYSTAKCSKRLCAVTDYSIAKCSKRLCAVTEYSAGWFKRAAKSS